MLSEVLSREDFAALGAPDLVYVRPVRVAELIALGAEPADGVLLDPDQTLYAIHRADGARLGVMEDKESAVAAALAHELAPVSVH